MQYIFRTLSAMILALVFLPLMSGCGMFGGTRPQAAQVEETQQKVELFYVTNRAPDAGSGRYFSGTRGDLSYGVTTTGIPPGHVMGRHEEPSLLMFEWEPDEHKHIKVLDVLNLTRDEFARRLGGAIEASPDAKLMIFVHGYNEEFLEASRTVAQFAHDLKFEGPVVLYSWPSQGSLTGYTVDETNAEWAQTDFVTLMTELLDKLPVQNIYLVGHSMGNRIIGRAMVTLASERLESDMLVFRKIIMIAPDIDTAVFRKDIAPRLARTGIHVTLYASSNDRALLASKAFHGYPRAGESGEGLVVVEGVETIDASEMAGGLLGHSYFAEDRRIMEDLFALLQSGQRADRRFGLEALDSDQGRYWTFRK
jgi:esterase/lipase superfamily enzyme